MDRRQFFSFLPPLASIGTFFNNGDPAGTRYPPPAMPPYLKKGDIIGITSPAGYISENDVQPCVLQLQEWGFTVKTGDTIGAKDYTFGGTDELRAKDFQKMLDDAEIKAIMCARGGYGTVRIIDKLSFKKFTQHPKWIIGFSDATIFHSHLNKNFGIASLHSKMCNSFPADRNNSEPVQVESIDSIRKCLSGEKLHYSVASNVNNRLSSGEGILIGGNLSILENLAGTPSDIDTEGKILFIEEVDEYLYSIDRMLWNLKRTAKFQKLKGLIVGGFNRIKPDDPGEEFGKTIYEMIMEKISAFDYPVCFDFPVGHQKYNLALKCGVRHALTVTADKVLLKQL